MKNLVAALVAVVLVGCGSEAEDAQDKKAVQAPSGMTMRTSVSCSLVGTSSSVTSWGHDVYKFSDGSVMASCTVSVGDAAASGMKMFKADMVGAATGYCSVWRSWVDGTGFGWWSFEQGGSFSRATYHETGSPNDGQSRSLTCTTY